VLARKGDERDGGIAKLTDAIAHGDRVLVARESGEMAMKDQQNRSAPMVSQSPPPALLVEQVDVRGTVARLDAHTIASPNWNNIEVSGHRQVLSELIVPPILLPSLRPHLPRTRSQMGFSDHSANSSNCGSTVSDSWSA
jgi:hypothetical protein